MLPTVPESIQKVNPVTLTNVSEPVTLITIAKELGVSRTTVSNAYNRPDQISAATRERVFEAAKRLGYAGPDPRAANLRRGVVGAIGLIEKSLAAALTDPASLLMLSGVAEACDEAGVALVLIPRHTTGDSAHDIVRSAVVDGFVAHCDALDDERRTIVEDRRLPMVVLDGRAGPDEPVVGIEEERGAHDIADHVIRLGHRRIAIVAFQPLTTGMVNTVTQRRLAGYRTACREHGIDVDAVPVVDGFAYEREAMTRVGRAAARASRPTDRGALHERRDGRRRHRGSPRDRAAGPRRRVRRRLRRHGDRRHRRPAAHDRPPAARGEGGGGGAHAARRRRRPTRDLVPGRARRASVDRCRTGAGRTRGQSPATAIGSALPVIASSCLSDGR